MQEASTECLAIAFSAILGLKVTLLDKNAIFIPNTELEAIARQSVEVEPICAYFRNIGRNSGYFLLPIFWVATLMYMHISIHHVFDTHASIYASMHLYAVAY